MERILEPELMEDETQVLAYSNADFTSSNKLFIDYIINDFGKEIHSALDLGCGSGDVDIELAKRISDIIILAVDGSLQMTQLAKQKVSDNKLNNKIKIVKGKLPDLDIEHKDYDIIISKDLLHHIPIPDLFWNEAERLSNDNTVIYLMVLLRPETIEKARQIVYTISYNEPEILKTDFYNSLLAAFTIEEIKHQIDKTSLDYKIENIGDRHFIVRCKKNNKINFNMKIIKS